MSALTPYYSLRNDGSKMLRNGGGAILRNEQVLDYSPPLCICVQLSPQVSLNIDLLTELLPVPVMVSYDVAVAILPEIAGTGQVFPELEGYGELVPSTGMTGDLHPELVGEFILEPEQELAGKLETIYYIGPTLLGEVTIKIQLRRELNVEAEIPKCPCQ